LIIAVNRSRFRGRRRDRPLAAWICADFPRPLTGFIRRNGLQNRPILHLVPHWNWAGSEGKPIKVFVALANVERVELFLNGKSLGTNPVDKYQMLTTEVNYEPGKLEAVGYNG
jgi:beta-galactosidase